MTKIKSQTVGANNREYREQKVLGSLRIESIDAELQPKIDRVFSIGKAEGYTDSEICSMVRERMKPYYSETTIVRALLGLQRNGGKIQ